MKKFAALVSVLGVTFAAEQARAEFGNEGDVSFSADRLSGLYIQGGAVDATTFGLGSDAFGAWWAHNYTQARFGVDFIVVDHLSIGGNLAIWFADNDNGPRDDSTTGFLIYPRVGYVVQINDWFGFWPRGGITFQTIEGNDEVALTFEAVFYAEATEHFGFTFGPNLDIGFAGDGDETRSFGLIVGGLFGWL